MVTVVYKVQVKEGREEEFRGVALACERVAHESRGCIYYSFFRSLTNSREFVVFYRFSSKRAQDSHIKHLQEVLGSADKGRDLPRKFMDLVENEDLVLFNVED